MENTMMLVYAVAAVGLSYLCLLTYSEIKDYLIEKKHIKKINQPFNYDLNDDLNEKVFGDLLS